MNSSERIDKQDGMWAVCRRLPSDFEPYGEFPRDAGPDCSCGCRHFVNLYGSLAFEWGVCANPRSPRAGLLTFEHQGCPCFEPESGMEEEVPVSGEFPEPETADDGNAFFGPSLRRVAIDWNDFDLAVQGGFGDEASVYLNRQTGEVAFLFSDSEEEEALRERIEEEWGEWIQIEGIDSRTGFKIMERFALSQGRPHVRKILIDALSGPRPFRCFKDAVGLHDEVRQDWFAFEKSAHAEALVDWLRSHGIDPQWTGPGAPGKA